MASMGPDREDSLYIHIFARLSLPSLTVDQGIFFHTYSQDSVTEEISAQGRQEKEEEGNLRRPTLHAFMSTVLWCPITTSWIPL